MQRRTFTILIVLALMVATAAISWLAASSIQSPAEAAARTAPPTPAPILVPVESRVLTADVVTRGTARFGSPRQVAIAASPAKAEAGIITTLAPADGVLQEGDVLLTISGRPLFLLQGEIPVYRDLGPGTVGADVRQLEESLSRLGFEPGTIDGRYDEETSAAVAAWYAAAGWPAFTTTAAAAAAHRRLEQELTEAEDARLAAAAAAATAQLAVDAARAASAAADQAAQLAVEEAATDAARTAAAAAAAATQLQGEVTLQQAADRQAEAARAADRASNRAAQLRDELEAARIAAAAKVPADEIIFVATLPVRVEEFLLDVGERAAGPAATVTDERIVVDASLPLDEAPFIQPGMAVSIDEPDLGIRLQGKIGWVADAPGTNGVDGSHVYFETTVDDAPATVKGVSMRLTIPVKSTAGQVLVVPTSALFLSADGTTRLQVAHEGSLVEQVVEPGLAADGFVEIRSVEGGVTVGDLVAVGYEISQEEAE